jgi:hypothetical protein
LAVLDAGDAQRLADRFGLGDQAVLSGPVASGEQGAVWRLETDAAMFAVKDVLEPTVERVARATAQFQDAADAAGVLTPSVVRAVTGDVFARIGDARVRVYRWVNLRRPDLGLDPVRLERSWLLSIDCSVAPWARSSGGTPRRSGRRAGTRSSTRCTSTVHRSPRICARCARNWLLWNGG